MKHGDALQKRDTASNEVDGVAPFRNPWFAAGAHDLRLTRFLLLRALGAVYLVAFLIVVDQFVPLLGSRGLLPVDPFKVRLLERGGSFLAAFLSAPSLLWVSASDSVIIGLGWLGVALSASVLLGFANAPLLCALWVVYSSFVNMGQLFYGYGWELLLLEAFLAIFLAPSLRLSPRMGDAPPLPVVWLYRWLTFRVMFGAGLIKLRGDPCWSDLSCLRYHYETQPNPHYLSWLLHQAPNWFHSLGILFNHFVELVAVWGLFGPRRLRHLSASLIVLFQVSLILSGNLSFLNWLTIAVALAGFDDELWRRLLPSRALSYIIVDDPNPLGRGRRAIVVALSAVIGLLSLSPIMNMLSPRQRMNASFDPLHLVNTYGAFGSIGRVRHEIVLSGSDAEELSPTMTFREYEFPCKPGDVRRASRFVTPYHYRLDWQMWFAAFSSYEREPWFVHLLYKLLQGDSRVLSLFTSNPFPDKPPRFIRADLYRYEFTQLGELDFWRRHFEREYVPVTSLSDPGLRRFLAAYGWLGE